MLATELTENTEVFSFVEAASAANSSRSDGLFAAEAAPTFIVVQIKTTKQDKTRQDKTRQDKTRQAFASVANNYRINPLSLVKTQNIKW